MIMMHIETQMELPTRRYHYTENSV